MKSDNKIAFHNSIKSRILFVVVVLFAVIAAIVSIINQNNIRRVYEDNYTERVLLTNSLMASYVDSKDVSYFVNLLKSQDEGFKQRQVQFYYDREELFSLQAAGASEDDQRELLASLNAFHSEMAKFKNDNYWRIIDELKQLKETSRSAYVYVMSDMGLTTESGEKLYTFIFDAEDDATYDSPDVDGLGTCIIGEDYLDHVYESKAQMEYAEYYDGEYGELYFAYAPILDDGGNVIAVLGTDLELGNMNSLINSSSLTFNIVFLTLFAVSLIFVFVFLTRSVIRPLRSLTDTARELKKGNIDAAMSEDVLRRKSEIGVLALAFKEAVGVHKKNFEDEEEYRKKLHSAMLREQEANQQKSQFLAHMSHEIRTPMNAIMGITEIELHNESLAEETEKSLCMIYESGNVLLGIINDILDLSKIEAGKLEIVPVKYDIPSLVNDAVQINRIRFESKPIEFLLEIDENTPLNLFGDELRIKQILNNILSNAFKYTDEGSVRLSVWCDSGGVAPSELEEGEVTLIVQVSDTGQGMTSEQVDKLFVEYTRFNLDLNIATEGAGLGMTITKHLLDLMGGEIFVESEPGKGSVFTVLIPQKRVNNLVCGTEMVEIIRKFRFQSTAMAKRSRTPREYMPYGSVLVVDDVESNAYVARGMLLPYGLKVDSVSSGEAAIEKVKSGNVYDIIFMDHMMPRMDGMEATNILRGMGYMQSIVALTANALVGHAETFLHNGFDGYISKPIDSRELNAVLVSFIRDRKPPEVVEAARREQQKKRAGDASDRQRAADSVALSEVLESFLSDVENVVAVLEKTIAKRSGIDEADMKSYRIAAHGIKTALANIGEKELAAFAYKLEQAAMGNDVETIRFDTPDFIDALNEFANKLRP